MIDILSDDRQRRSAAAKCWLSNSPASAAIEAEFLAFACPIPMSGKGSSVKQRVVAQQAVAAAYESLPGALASLGPLSSYKRMGVHLRFTDGAQMPAERVAWIMALLKTCVPVFDMCSRTPSTEEHTECLHHPRRVQEYGACVRE
jgi:hypothetical protein